MTPRETIRIDVYIPYVYIRKWFSNAGSTVRPVVTSRLRNTRARARAPARHVATTPRDMNREVFALPPLRCELAQARDVLSALLHTIIFTRALGCLTPKEERCERLDVFYVTCGDAKVESKISEKINTLVQWALKTPHAQEADVCVSFYDRKEKQRGGISGVLSGRREERAYWEQWRIGLEIFNGEECEEEERARRAEALRDQVVGTQQHILGLVNEMKGHLPAVTTSDVVCFPFEISVPIAHEDSPGSFGRDMLKRLASLSSTPPTMI